MAFQVNFTHFHSVFAIPSSVVDEHLRLCGAAQLKVLLYLLRHSATPQTEESLAEALRLSVGDVADALCYWRETGLVLEAGTPLPPIATVATAVAPPASATQPPTSPPAPTTIHPGEATPRLTRQEVIRLMQEDGSLRQLAQEVQGVLGKPISPVEMDTLAALHCYYGLASDFILAVIHYCQTLGKSNMRYVEKTAATWVDMGVDTFEKAEEYMEAQRLRSSREGSVRTALGIGERRLIPSEQKYITSWFEEFGYDIPLIRLAYERMIENIGKLNFPYLHKILASWHQKGIKTPKEAALEMTSRAPTNGGKNASYDIAELERRMLDDFINQK